MKREKRIVYFPSFMSKHNIACRNAFKAQIVWNIGNSTEEEGSSTAQYGLYGTTGVLGRPTQK